MTLAYFSVRIALAGILGLAAASKLRDPRAFRAGVRHYGLVPRWAVAPTVLLVIGGEVAAAALLLVDVPHGLGAALAAILLGAFSIALFSNSVRGRRTPCHCFGSSQTELTDWTATVRSIGLTLLALAILGLGLREPDWPSAADAVAGVAIAAGIVLVTRLVGFAPQAWSYLRAPRPLCSNRARQPFSLNGKPLEPVIKQRFALRASELREEANAVRSNIGKEGRRWPASGLLR